MIKPGSIIRGGILFGIISLIILSILTLSSSYNQLIYKSILLGNLIAFISFILVLLFAGWGIPKSNKQFLISLYGGMVTRLVLSLVLVIIVLIFLEINEISFIFSNLFFYIFYVIVEIVYFNRRER